MNQIDRKRAKLTEQYDSRLRSLASRMHEVPQFSPEYTTLEALRMKLFGRFKANMLTINLGSDLALYDNTSQADDTDSASSSDIDMLDYLNQLDIYINDNDPSAEFLALQIYNNLQQQND